MSTPSVSKLSGTGYNAINVPKLSPQQQQLFQQVFSGVQGGFGKGLGQLGNLAGGGSEADWSALEGPALRQFSEQIGQLSSRFSGGGGGQGALGARKSSGFHNQAGGAAADLAERLQSQRLGHQQNAMQQLMQLYQSLMGTQQFETGFTPKQKPFWQELLGGAASGIGQGLGSLAFL
jgi:hypothetical protein